MLSKRFFEEDGNFYFDVVPAAGRALARLVRTLTKRRRRYRRNLRRCSFALSLLELTAELRVVAMLPQLVVLGLVAVHHSGLPRLQQPL
jgi:hypothetical protein